MTKTFVSEQLRTYKKHGIVLNFNSNKKFHGSFKGHPDFEILINGYLIYIEVKLKSTKDKIRPEQLKFKTEFEKVEAIALGNLIYKTLETEKDLENVIRMLDDIIMK